MEVPGSERSGETSLKARLALKSSGTEHVSVVGHRSDDLAQPAERRPVEADVASSILAVVATSP